jgi:two-component sensor histidine kinase
LRASGADVRRVDLLLQLSNLYYYKPTKSPVDLEKVLQDAGEASVLAAKLGDSIRYHAALQWTAYAYIDQNELLLAEAVLNKVDQATKLNLYLALGYKYVSQDRGVPADNQKEGMQFAKAAESLSRRLHDKEKEILSQLEIADVHVSQHTDEAEKELLAVIRRYDSIDYPYLHYTYLMLGEYHLDGGNYEKALYYSIETIKSMNRTGDLQRAGDFYYWQANVYSRIGQFQKSIDDCELAIEQYKVRPGEANIPACISLEARELRTLKRYRESVAFLKESIRKYPPSNLFEQIVMEKGLGDSYRELKQYDSAEVHFLKMIELGKKQNIHVGGNTDDMMAQLYVEWGKYRKARPYLLRAVNDAHLAANKGALGHLQYMLFLADSADGDYLSAIRHLQKNKKLDDSLLTQSKTEALQKLLVQYETEKKADSIRNGNQKIALLDQRDQLQQGKIRQGMLIEIVTVAGLVLISVVLALLYFQYRAKLRMNKVITNKNLLLQRLLDEEEWLLKELHHRVKNNLHMVICLLEAQAANLEDDALKAVEDIERRIYAMSLLHQKLYLGEDIKSIDMSMFLPELIHYLRDSFETDVKIKFRLDIDPVPIGISQGIPLALIVTEAITNSIKYAFPGRATGTIGVSMHEIAGKVVLEIRDDGIGVDPNLTRGSSGSLGFELMNGLSGDINARIDFETKGGTKIILTFTLDTLTDHTNFLETLKKKIVISEN